MGAVHLLPGTTFSSTKERGEYDSARHAVMTVSELELWLTLQITGVYHYTFHSGLGGKPIDIWKERFDPRCLRYPARLDRLAK